jgi:catechol 2,3-dioxygenase-like lactoylglutathione lyase family enzyme
LDKGLTHIAFMVSDLDASIAFYDAYAGMKVVHHRAADDGTGRVAWISDGTRPFVIVLIESPAPFPGSGLIPRALSSLMPHFAHLGVACESRSAVDEACARAAEEGILELPARDLGPTVGYLGLIRDPDGNSLEVSYGQEVGLAVALGDAPSD